MTAPDSRDSVERIAEELRAYDGDPFGTAKHVFRGWADRLQAIARGPQQAGGEEHLKAMEARIEAIVSCAQGRWPEVTTLESAWDRMCADRNDKESALQAEVARLQRALNFWLPTTAQVDPEFAERVRDDAMLLMGYTGDGDALCYHDQATHPAEAALREARELLFQVKNFGGTKAGALDAFLARTDKGPKDG